MTCPKCGGPARCKVHLFLDIPDEFDHRLTKAAVASRGVRVDGAGWDRALYYCPYAQCGWSLYCGPTGRSAPAGPSS